MLTKFKRCSVGLLAFCSVAVSAAAQTNGPEFSFTQEFLTACHTSNITLDTADSVFKGLSWGAADADITDIMKPDDVMNKVYKHQAWSIELEDGSQWFGAVSEGKLNKKRYTYCSMMIVVGEFEGWRADLEKTPGLTKFDKISSTENSLTEHRWAYHAGNQVDSIIVREMSADDVLVVSMGKFVPTVKKSKKKG